MTRRNNMKLEDLANNDNIIKSITCKEDMLCLEILCWDEKRINILFHNLYGIKANMAINQEIGDIKKVLSTPFSLEIRNDIISGDGDESEYTNLQKIVFYDSWSERCVLEVIAETEEIIEQNLTNH